MVACQDTPLVFGSEKKPEKLHLFDRKQKRKKGSFCLICIEAKLQKSEAKRTLNQVK
jgi:hypothetical protein